MANPLPYLYLSPNLSALGGGERCHSESWVESPSLNEGGPSLQAMHPFGCWALRPEGELASETVGLGWDIRYPRAQATLKLIQAPSTLPIFVVSVV